MEVDQVRRFVPDVIWLNIINWVTGGQARPLGLSVAGKRFLLLAADRRVNRTLTLKYVCTSQNAIDHILFVFALFVFE